MSRTTVLVFDGGATKCVFQLGLMQLVRAALALDDVTQHVGLVFGVSAGAIVAAIVAFGLLDQADKFTALMPELFRAKNDLGPMLAPMYDGQGKSNALRKVFGNLRLGAARVPLAVLTTRMSNGAPLLFTSIDSKHRDLLVADVLDATTAAPVFYPPVHLDPHGFLIDGGTTSNIPLTQAYLLATIELRLGPVRMLSLGCTDSNSLNIDSAFAEDMGVLSWAKNGLFDILLGVADDTSQRLMVHLLGAANFMRVTTSATGGFKALAAEDAARFASDVHAKWAEHGTRMLTFFQA